MHPGAVSVVTLDDVSKHLGVFCVTFRFVIDNLFTSLLFLSVDVSRNLGAVLVLPSDDVSKKPGIFPFLFALDKLRCILFTFRW